jgi:hypothetical protein
LYSSNLGKIGEKKAKSANLDPEKSTKKIGLTRAYYQTYNLGEIDKVVWVFSTKNSTIRTLT